MLIFKTVYCLDCKKRKEIDSEPRNITCHKCGSENVNLSDWTIRWYEHGKPLTKILSGATKKDALEARMAAVNGSEYIRLSRKAPIKFGQAADQYLEHCKHQASYDHKKFHIEHFKTLWGTKPLYEISTEAVRTEHNNLAKSKSQSTANRYLAALKAMYTFAELNKHIDYSILHDMRKVKKFQENNERERYLTVQEYNRLIKAAKLSSCPDMADIINFAIFTGLRQANVLACRHDKNIDRENGLLRYGANVMKGKKTLVIPMSSMIQDMIQRRPRGINSPYLFFKENGEPYTRFQIDYYFRGILENAKIKDFHFHDLRHTLASWLAMSGSNAKHIQEILGHADLKTSQRYTHLSVDHKRAAIGAVEAVLTGGEK